MNNKPVAWAIKADNDFTEIGFDNQLLEEIEQMYVMEGWKYEVIPLYTHPVKEQEPDLYSEDGFPLWTSPQFKELTDEEIAELSDKILCYQIYDNKESGVFEFARAILRKAQEK